MIVIDKLNELKVLILINFNITNIKNVKKIYKNKTFKDCLNISVELKVIKFVKDFFKLSSKISIKRIGLTDNPIPSTRELAKYCYPDYQSIIKNVKQILL